MITHTSDLHKIPSQNKTKSKLQILKHCQKLQFCKKALHATHPLKFLDKMYEYEMDPTRTLGALGHRMDGPGYGWTEWNQ